jgi:hypothetical protein
MRARQQPREVRDGYPYFTAKRLDDGAAPVVMRQPRAAQMAVAHAAIASARAAKLDEALALGQKLQISQGVFASLASLIGLCWADRERDLETAVPKGQDDVETYGLAVIDELTEAGFSQSDVAVLGFVCLAEISKTDGELMRALDALGFTGRRAGSTSPSNISPGSNGGETPTQSVA